MNYWLDWSAFIPKISLKYIRSNKTFHKILEVRSNEYPICTPKMAPQLRSIGGVKKSIGWFMSKRMASRICGELEIRVRIEWEASQIHGGTARILDVPCGERPDTQTDDDHL